MGSMKQEIPPDLIREAKAIAGRSECEVLELSLRRTGRISVLHVIADRTGGITVDQCASLHRALRLWIEQFKPDWNDWRIEVSSPGLNRPLKTERDFTRQTGRMIRIEWTQNGARQRGVGTVRAAAEGAVEIEIEGRTLRIPLAEIADAHIHVKW
jgi:ribosome maturation factor RimP